MFDNLKKWAKTLKREIYTVYLIGRDKRTPLFVKLLAISIAAYALSPIDLIPDFIPVIGYLDDLIIIPLGIWIIIRMIPESLLFELREKADKKLLNKQKKSLAGALIIVIIWLLILLSLLKVINFS